MTHDPRHLLGGYATGNLSPEERRALFAAALQDPDLFAALTDEEALRDLLAHPESRARIQAALAPRAHPFWRRPALLGSAAGLLFVAGTTALLWRDQPAPLPAPIPRALPVPESQSPEPPASPAVPKAPLPPATRSKAPAAPQAMPAPGPTDEMETEPPSAPVGGSLEAPAALRASPARNLGPEAPPPAARAVLAEKAFRPHLSEPRLTHLPDGRFRLETAPPATRHPYLLLRRGQAVHVLAAQRDPHHGGLRFEGHLEPGDLLDFYLLEAPSLDPAGLPSQGPVPGLRKRIYPSLP